MDTAERNINALRSPDSWHPQSVLDHLTVLAREALITVEVGSWLGHSASALARGTPGKVYCVDHWRGSDSGTGVVDWPLALYERFLSNIRADACGDRIVPLLGDSQVIAELFAKQIERSGKIDLLYIDGDHRFEAVTRDLTAWTPCVRAGGLVCGDDYAEVKEAVDRFFRAQPAEAFETRADGRLWVVRYLPGVEVETEVGSGVYERLT